MNQGLTPCDKRRDEFISMKVFDKKKGEEVTWTPSNANGRFSGDSIPLRVLLQEVSTLLLSVWDKKWVFNVLSKLLKRWVSKVL